MTDAQPFDPHAPDADPDKPINTRTAVNGQVTLVENDPTWPAMFQREVDRIRAALGDRALTVEHIGSTSVPDLIAKPCIDILLVVEDAGADDAYIPKLQRAGYVLRRSEVWHGEEHRLLKEPNINLNLHVWSAGSHKADRLIQFRDWLRTHHEDRERYATAKRELAGHHWTYLQDYADAKDDIVREITERIELAKTGAS